VETVVKAGTAMQAALVIGLAVVGWFIGGIGALIAVVVLALAAIGYARLRPATEPGPDDDSSSDEFGSA
jgi:hypothetical protein